MELKAGQRLNSAVCDAQVVVVKAPADAVEIQCGGVPMIDGDQERDASATTPDGDEGPALGKRYASEELGLELLCTRAGSGALAVDGEVLPIKGAKPLPASD
ncbi:MAG: hypothetical protein U5K30_09985 [Acidimicrobiales bacterium]|nr:hypothetical protein [Acidimicrobiales bacterium]